MDNMFNECSELANIKFGVFDTSKNTTFRYMFNGTILKSIPELNASANTDTYSTYNSPIKCSRLRNFGGLKGINKT